MNQKEALTMLRDNIESITENWLLDSKLHDRLLWCKVELDDQLEKE